MNHHGSKAALQLAQEAGCMREVAAAIVTEVFDGVLDGELSNVQAVVREMLGRM